VAARTRAAQQVTTEPVRLPARGGDYTTARHRAIDGSAGEVDDAMLDVFADDAHERDQDRRRAERAPIAAAVDGAIAAMTPVTDLLASTRTPGVVTRDMRRRARRIAHDLAELRGQARPSTTSTT
jgi:hypothetical protein